MGDDKIKWIANEGVRISKILGYVQGLSLSGGQATLRKQMVESEKGWVGSKTSRESSDIEWSATESAGGGFTVPLRLTIGVGGSSAELHVGDASTSSEAGSSSAPTPADGGEQTSAPAQDEMVSAWKAYESTSRSTSDTSAVTSTTPMSSPTATREQTPLEWLAGPQNAAPSRMQEQFARNGAH
jgi:hypothetical protein